MGNSSIRILKANHGEAFIINCQKGNNHGLVVIDGGPSNKGGMLMKELLQLGIIDLMVLTHFDDDHIGGIMKYVEYWKDRPMEFPVHELWVNNSDLYPIGWNNQLSDEQGLNLSIFLDKLSLINTSINWKKYIYEGYQTNNFPFADIEVIGPSLDYLKQEILVLDEMRQEQKCTVHQEDRQLSSTNEKRIDQKKKDLLTSLDDLALTADVNPDLSKKDNRANAVSISLIIRCDGLSILMLGDSYPQNIYKYLVRRGFSPEKPLVVDYVKVSHHGSKNNSSCKLYELIKCNHYIISTYGYKFYHPDRTTIAKILCHKKRNWKQTIYFYLNYPQENYEGDNAFINPGESDKYNFKIIYDNNTLPL